MYLLKYKSGGFDIINREPDSFEIRECEIKYLEPKDVRDFRFVSILASVTASILLAKQKYGKLSLDDDDIYCLEEIVKMAEGF